MKTWFTCKVKYTKIDENGKTKNVTEPYLVDAVSFTDAETRIYEKAEEFVDGEFFVTGISKSKIHDIFQFEDQGDRWFSVKVKYVSVEESSGKEKKVVNNLLVYAIDVKDAYEKTQEGLAEMLVPYEIPSISESPILDIFPYESEEEKELNKSIPKNLKPIEKVKPMVEEDELAIYRSEKEVEEEEEIETTL